MLSIGKVVTIVAVVAFALSATIVGRWYYTAAIEEVDPDQGVYGMSGLELWIDLNVRMPGFARQWGCDTLRARENAALGGQNSLPPYGCDPAFDRDANASTYDSVVNANLTQASDGLDADQIIALRTCFDARMSESVSAEDIDAVNDDPAGDAMTRVVLAVNENARLCRAELG